MTGTALRFSNGWSLPSLRWEQQEAALVSRPRRPFSIRTWVREWDGGFLFDPPSGEKNPASETLGLSFTRGPRFFVLLCLSRREDHPSFRPSESWSWLASVCPVSAVKPSSPVGLWIIVLWNMAKSVFLGPFLLLKMVSPMRLGPRWPQVTLSSSMRPAGSCGDGRKLGKERDGRGLWGGTPAS